MTDNGTLSLHGYPYCYTVESIYLRALSRFPYIHIYGIASGTKPSYGTCSDISSLGNDVLFPYLAGPIALKDP